VLLLLLMLPRTTADDAGKNNARFPPRATAWCVRISVLADPAGPKKACAVNPNTSTNAATSERFPTIVDDELARSNRFQARTGSTEPLLLINHRETTHDRCNNRVHRRILDGNTHLPLLMSSFDRNCPQ